MAKIKKGAKRRNIRKGQPTLGEFHISRPLTNISVAYMNDRNSFIADKVFPAIPVESKSDVYYKWDKDAFLRDEARERAPATESAGGGFSLAEDTYNTKVEAFHKDVDDQTRANTDSQFGLDRAVTELVSHTLLIRRERRFVNTYFKPGVWGAEDTPDVLWGNDAAKPKRDIDVAKLVVQKASAGRKANVLLLQAEVKSALGDLPAIREQFKYTSDRSIDDDMLARYFGVDRVLTLDAVFAANQEGATPDIQFMAGQHALLCHVATAPSLLTPTAGYTFHWTGFMGGVQGIRMKRMRMELIESDRIEGQMAHDQKIVAPAMGYFFANVLGG